MVTIRQALPGDADVIGAIWLEAFRVGYRGIVPDEAIARRTDEQAETYWQTRLADPCEPEESGYDCELWKLYIREAYHRRGIGRMLMVAMAERLAARGMRSMLLRAFVGNRADSFYERMGGQFLRTEPYEILGADVPTHLYGWPDLSTLQETRDRGEVPGVTTQRACSEPETL
jgi:GNAT superfamily N-acetyltransferase